MIFHFDQGEKVGPAPHCTAARSKGMERIGPMPLLSARTTLPTCGGSSGVPRRCGRRDPHRSLLTRKHIWVRAGHELLFDGPVPFGVQAKK